MNEKRLKEPTKKELLDTIATLAAENLVLVRFAQRLTNDYVGPAIIACAARSMLEGTPLSRYADRISQSRANATKIAIGLAKHLELNSFLMKK